MKYALIVMIAVYLVTFGCNPKSEEEHSAPQEKAEHASVAKAPETPATPENVHVTTEAAHPAPPADVTLDTKTAIEPTPQADPATQPSEAKVTAPPKAEEEPANQWTAIAASAATTVLALMNEDTEQNSEVVEQKAPEAEVVEPAPAKENIVEKETVVSLPCGKKIVKDGSAPLPPCIKHGAPVNQQSAAPSEEVELSEPMQKMVNATNDMVAVTRQLVIATQQMLVASREVAVEVIDSGKEAIETSKPAIQNAINEEEILETVKEVVAATKEAFEATSEALSEALEAKEATPAPEATPQQ